jgi:hypothetical protein
METIRFTASSLPLMARTGHGLMSDLSPLSGVERKLDFGVVRSAFDPKADISRVSGIQAAIDKTLA